jgi:transcription termination/antitermination protein NusA
MKGMRVQSIIRELRGEKIDIIEYHEDPVTFAEKALQPAKVSRVTVLEGQEKHLEVIVDDSQLSLAIGKKGQNVRLAAKLLGWKIDIKSEEEKRQEVEEQMRGMMGQVTTPIESVPDLEPGIVEKLVAAGITTVEAVADMTPEQLEEVPGIGPKTVEKISIAVNNYFASLDAGEAPAEGVEGVAEGAEVAAEGAEIATAAEGLPDAGEELGQDVSAEEEARESAAEGEAEAEESEDDVEAAERDDAGSDLQELGAESDVDPEDEGGQSGDEEGLSDEPEASSESVEELADEGQAFEAEVIDGVENAPLADEGERIFHERIETPNENVPDEEEPGEKR